MIRKKNGTYRYEVTKKRGLTVTVDAQGDGYMVAQ